MAPQLSRQSASREDEKLHGGIDGGMMANGQGKRTQDPAAIYGTNFRKSTDGPMSRGSDGTDITLAPNSPLSNQPVVLNESRNRFARTASGGV